MNWLSMILGVGVLPTAYLGMPLGAMSKEVWNSVVENVKRN